MKEDNSLDAVKEVFTQFLVERKHRKTPERYAILEHIFSHEGHFNAELLYNAMQKEYRVSLATVYNTLELLLECRLIVMRDVSEIIQSKNALKEAGKKLGLLTSITRHDILNQIMVISQILERHI